jgi:hypothetical protein
MAGSQSSSTYILVLYLYRQILVAYKWHFIVNKMIYVTEVCSNQFIRYMIALQSPYMIALSLYSWSRDRWQFIDVQRSHFLELKVNNPSTTPVIYMPPKFACINKGLKYMLMKIDSLPWIVCGLSRSNSACFCWE